MRSDLYQVLQLVQKYSFFVNARVRSTREGNVFTCLSVHSEERGNPWHLVLGPFPGRGGYTSQVPGPGYSHPPGQGQGVTFHPPPSKGPGQGYPPPLEQYIPPTGQTAGGMALVVTHEDFLVVTQEDFLVDKSTRNSNAFRVFVSSRLKIIVLIFNEYLAPNQASI